MPKELLNFLKIMNKTISVWLILEDGKDKGKIVLQKRSFKNKTFPFVCQATWAGKVEQGENIEDAISRECREELGNEFSDSFNFSGLEILSKSNFDVRKEKWESYNYLGKISERMLKITKIHEESLPEFIFLGEDDKFYSIESEKDPKNNIVLFNDQCKILKEILDGTKRNNK